MLTGLMREELLAVTQRNFEAVRLPYALDLKEEVDAGGMLNETSVGCLTAPSAFGPSIGGTD
jgi:hypothetical protein